MPDLFDAGQETGRTPLAAALRPGTLDDILGQDALVGPGSVLRRRIAANALGSVILYGPPGVGKTSIARAIGNMLGKEFRPFHATRDGVKELRRVSDEARIRPLLIFVDEVHRFSATQADDLLSICEEAPPILSERQPATPTTLCRRRSSLVPRSSSLSLSGSKP